MRCTGSGKNTAIPSSVTASQENQGIALATTSSSVRRKTMSIAQAPLMPDAKTGYPNLTEIWMIPHFVRRKVGLGIRHNFKVERKIVERASKFPAIGLRTLSVIAAMHAN
jgi:hypothetical protein